MQVLKKMRAIFRWTGSVLFGLASTTLLTVLVIPAIYVVLRDDERPLGTSEA
jgi:hypothetical protein